MKTILFACLMAFGFSASAQITKVSLQASGLTCSMCSKAVKIALEEISSVEKVQVDIKNQKYNLQFKEGEVPDLDALGKAVEDAGFSVASLQVTVNVDNIKLQKDEHIQIGNHYFHFLNGNGQQINGTAEFNVVDKKFVSAKDFKKYKGLTKMKCIETGTAASCCSTGSVPAASRIYHAIL